ncbi:MAG: AAA family ATPase [Chloroflexi bacterium]|nr:AAA family ATPase [Chloroflexota bacterium]
MGDTGANDPPVDAENKPEVCPICKGVGYLRRNVPVGHPDFGKLVPCRCKVKVWEKQHHEGLRRAGNLDVLERMRFATFLKEGVGQRPEIARNLGRAYETCQEFAMRPEGWLVLKGGYGCGKTHLVAAIANYLVERGVPAVFIVVPDLLDFLRAAYAPDSAGSYDERFDRVRNAEVLILDDLGTQSSTPWAQEKLFQIFNHRYNRMLPTVITTNLELEQFDPRLRSRLTDPGLVNVVTILAEDFRGSGPEHSIAELSSLAFLADKTFDNFDPRSAEVTRDIYNELQKALKTCQDFAENPAGWLLLLGGYGSGKTHLAAAIANYRLSGSYPTLFVAVPDLLDHLRATYSPASPISYDKRFEQIRTTELLVLDDLGAQSATPWAQEKLYQLFNYRYNAHLPTVITTALPFEEIDPRLRARLMDESLCQVLKLSAPSYAPGRKETKSPPARGGGRGKRLS